MAITKRFRVALSFPGEKRSFIEVVAQQLASWLGQDRVLYDKFYEAEFARPNLDIYLQRLYHYDSELVAVFLCAEYERKEWCFGLEWRAIRDLIKAGKNNDVMLFRFDNTEIPGSYGIDGYVWIGERSPEDIAKLILQRLELVSAETTSRAASALNEDQLRLGFQRISTSLTSRSVSPTEWILRPEEEQLTALVDEDEGSTVCLIGPPGSGKTALLAKISKDGGSKGYTIAVKADLIPHDEQFARWAEREVGLGIPLIDAVKAAAANRKVVVIVDQLDALASLVDLTSDRLNDVIDFILQCARIPGVSIVCSCREFEYHRDTRFASLDAERIDLDLPKWDQIVVELKKAGIDNAETWPQAFREILRTPQHLQIYLRRFKETGKSDVFGSYQAMLDDLWSRKLTTEKQRDFIYRLAEYLVDKEALWAPSVQFESDGAIVDQLVAEEIIQRLGRQVGFRHQTLLEHAKARLFTKTGRSLCDYVLERLTAILVRPTLWAVLRYLREADPTKYREELDRLMASDLRLHIRYLLIDCLSQVGQPEDFEVVHMTDRLKEPDDRLRVLIAVRGREKWFRAMTSAVFPMVMSWKPHEQWPMVGVIADAWHFAREDCLRLVERYWFADPEKDGLTWQSLREIDHWDERTVGLICKVIRRTGSGEDRLWWAEDIVYRVSADAPKLAPQVFLAVVARQGTSSADGAEPPNTPTLTLHSQLDSANVWYKLPEVAAASPIDFLRATWTWFVETATRFHSSCPSSVLNEYGGYLTALDCDDDDLSRPVTTAVLTAVVETAKADPTAFVKITRASRSIDNQPVQRVLARGFAVIASQHPEWAFDFLIEDQRRFMLEGFSDGESETRTLITAIASNWDKTGRKKLEKAILSWTQYRPGIEVEDCQRQWDREARLRLLTAIPERLLSPEVALFVEKEKQELPEWNRQRRGGRSGFVREVPPLTREEMATAPDEKVLESLRGPQHHDRATAEWKETDDGWEQPGGAWAATTELAELAKTNRGRVLALLPKLMAEGNEAPAAHVLHALADTDLPTAEAFDLVRQLASFTPKSDGFRSDASYLLYKRCESQVGLPDDLCAILETWLVLPWSTETPFAKSAGGETDTEEERNPTSVLWGYRGGIFLDADKSFFPLAAATNGYLMRAPADTERWLECVSRHLDRNIAEGTWLHYCSELRCIRLKGCDPEKGVSVVLKLFDRYPNIKFSVEGCRLVANVSGLLPEDVLRSFLDDLLASGRFRDQQAFGELLTLIALRRDAHEWTRFLLEENLNEIASGVAGKEGMAVGIAFAAAHLWDESEARPEACQVLCRLIPVATGRIGEAIGTVFWTAEDFPADTHTDALLQAIGANSNMLSGGFVSDLIELMAELLPHSRRNVLNVCQAIVKGRGAELTSISRELYLSGPHLVNIAMTLQRFADTRAEGLSLLEDLLRLGLDEAFSILHDIDIRPATVRRREPRNRRRRSPRGGAKSRRTSS